MARSVPLSRSTLRVGGGSAFFVRHQRRTQNMKENKCDFCENGSLVPGTLEAVSFVPTTTKKIRFFKKGVYGIKVFACLNCGRLSHLALDVDTLKEIVS